MQLIFEALYNFLNLYFIVLIVRVLLTWFPNIDWFNQPWATLSQLTDPYLDLFRKFIPPLAGIDFSPIVAIFLLQLFQGLLGSLAAMA